MGRKGQRLQQTISIIEQRWGPSAIGKIESSSPRPILPTSFPCVDRMTGGIPRGRITELIGSGTSGQTTLAAHVLSQAQKLGHPVVYVDVEHTVDLDFLARCGIEFGSLTILRPWSFQHGIQMAGDLIRNDGLGVLVFDRVPALPSGPDDFHILDVALREWLPFLNRSLCAVIFLTEVDSVQAYPPDLTLPYFSSLRLSFQREEWLYRKGQVKGYVSTVAVLKNKFGPSGQSTTIQVRVANGAHGEDA